MAERIALFQILSGTWLAQACYALASLGVADLLADGPRQAASLARESGTDRRALLRVLRAVAAAGLARETAPGEFALTSLGQPLLSGVPRSSHQAAVMFGEEVHASFAEITHTLRTGRPAFEKVYGQSFYDYLGDHPEAARRFAAAMGAAPVPAALAACDVSGARLIVDVGGGDGGLLARVLRAQPQARGVLLDLPAALAQAPARLARAGVADRAQVVAGSFFDPLPAGGDVYLLSRVLHNWDDDDAARVLGRLRAAVAPGGRLVVFEELLPDGQPAGSLPATPSGEQEPARPGGAPTTPGQAAPGQAAPGQAGTATSHLIDLLMLVMLSGCDRTEQEYRALLAGAGFEVTSVRQAPLRPGQAESVIEAVPC
ncbi:MAG TPA: methyltransferase [Streptosporangiaceae bacterium]|jgi:SAM-dependent methyltransferase